MKVRKKSGMSAEEHASFGADLQEIQEFLNRSQRFFTDRFGKVKYCSLKVAETLKHFEELRYVLDDLATGTHQTKVGQFYYGRKFEEVQEKDEGGNTLIPKLADLQRG